MEAAVGKEAAGVSGSYGIEGRRGGGDNAGKGPFRPTTQGLLDLGEGQLDRIEVGE